MIVYASSAEYINSTWVKNEWHRYEYGERINKIKYVNQKSTNDKVFLLSVDEIKKYVSERDMNYSIISKDGIKSSYRGNWKSRTIGTHRYKNNDVSVLGFVANNGSSYLHSDIRPAMWVDISSNEDLSKKVQKEKDAENKRIQEMEIARKAAEERRAIELRDQEIKVEGKTNLILGLITLITSIIILIIMMVAFSNLDSAAIGLYIFICILAIVPLIISIILLKEATLLLRRKKLYVSNWARILRITQCIIFVLFFIVGLIVWFGDDFWVILLAIMGIGGLAISKKNK